MCSSLARSFLCCGWLVAFPIQDKQCAKVSGNHVFYVHLFLYVYIRYQVLTILVITYLICFQVIVAHNFAIKSLDHESKYILKCFLQETTIFY